LDVGREKAEETWIRKEESTDLRSSEGSGMLPPSDSERKYFGTKEDRS